MLAGAVRLGKLASRPEVTAENARFVENPAPVVIHIVGIITFCLLGSLQFVPRLRRGRWHRYAGRAVVPAGIAVALSGMWMTLGYDLPPEDTVVLNAVRLVVGTGLTSSLLLGYAAARRRDFHRHRVWMTRSVALVMGTPTQALLMGPWALAFGPPSHTERTVLMILGWVVSVGFAETLLRRRRALSAAGAPARA